jgi:hypothetical protein
LRYKPKQVVKDVYEMDLGRWIDDKRVREIVVEIIVSVFG